MKEFWKFGEEEYPPRPGGKGRLCRRTEKQQNKGKRNKKTFRSPPRSRPSTPPPGHFGRGRLRPRPHRVAQNP